MGMTSRKQHQSVKGKGSSDELHHRICAVYYSSVCDLKYRQTDRQDRQMAFGLLYKYLLNEVGTF